MNIKKLNSIIFPVLTGLFLLLAWVTGGEDLMTTIQGETADGSVSALVRCYQNRCDLIVDIEQDLSFTQADGTVFSAKVTRDGVADQGRFSENQLAAINTVNGVKADAIKRFLLRENDKQTGDRIVEVIRTERAHLLQDIPVLINDIELTENGRVASVSDGKQTLRASESDRLLTRIRFTYIGGSEEADVLKTEVKTSASRTLNGEPVEHESEDFVLYATDFHYVFRAVFTYNGEFGPTAAVADVGARKSPRGGHRIGDELLIAYMPGEPGRATILSDFAQLKKLNWLDAINRFFEITFGRWFFPAVSLLIAFIYLMMSIITVPLMLKPPKTENADTVDEKALSAAAASGQSRPD